MIKAAPAVRKVRVTKGDTLTSIAKQWFTTVPRLITANPGINPNLIEVGQVLNL
jgi:LysM repeat protein